MDKVKVEFKAPANVTIDYNGVNVDVKSHLMIAEQVYIIEEYVKAYFNKEDDSGLKALNADVVLKNLLLQLCTNIDIDSLDNEVYGDEELWNLVRAAISNYYKFQEFLYEAVAQRREEIALENSIGTIISGLVEKGYSLLEKFAETSPEEIQKLQKSAVELVERLENSSVLNENAPIVKKKAAPRKKSVKKAE